MQADLVETKNWTSGSVPGRSGHRPSSAKILRVLSLVGSRGSAILAQFATQLVVGALAGASGLGVLQLLTSWTCIAGEALAMGLPSRAMRQVSVAYSTHVDRKDSAALQAENHAHLGMPVGAHLTRLRLRPEGHYAG